MKVHRTYIYIYIYTYICIQLHPLFPIDFGTCSGLFFLLISRKCVMQVLDLAIAGMAGAGLGVKEEHVCPRCWPNVWTLDHTGCKFLLFWLKSILADWFRSVFHILSICDRLLVLDLFGKKKCRMWRARPTPWVLLACAWVDRSGPKLELKHEGCNNWDVWCWEGQWYNGEFWE